MLTLKDINEVSFGKAGFSGYKPEDVDNFIDEVVDTYKQLIAGQDHFESQIADLSGKNAELQEKLAILAKKVESYREDEDRIKEAILTAQRMSKQTVSEANEQAAAMLEAASKEAETVASEAKSKSAQILSDAKDEADIILSGARTEAAMLAKQYAEKAEEKKYELDEVKKQVAAFRASLLEMYKKHLEQINHIPVFRVKQNNTAETEVPQETPAAAPARIPQPETQQIDAGEPAAQTEKPAVQPPETVAQEPVSAPAPVPVSASQTERPRPQPRSNNGPRQRRPGRAAENTEEMNPLRQRVDYIEKEETEIPGNDLSHMGIVDTRAFSIPETLRKEKEAGFSNLEFGDGVDITHKK